MSVAESAAATAAVRISALRYRWPGSAQDCLAIDELRLSAVAVRGDNEAARDAIGDVRPEVAANEVQAQVDPRRTARRGQDRPFIDVQDVGIEG